MTTKKDQSDFASAYGAIHFAAQMAEGMCDERGNLKPTPIAKIEEFKRACRESSCAAGAICGTHDGRKS